MRPRTRWRIVLVAAVSAAFLAGCGSTPGVLVGARDNTAFAQDDSPYLVMKMHSGATDLRSLRGEHIRTLLPAGDFGLFDTDDSGLRIIGRDSIGAFRAVAGESPRRLDLLIEWTANMTLNGPGTRIAATNGPGGRLRIVSFDTGEVLLSRDCPAAASCFWMGWDTQDPDVVWLLGKTHDGYVRVNIASGETALFSRDVNLPIRQPMQNALSQTTCRQSGAKLVASRDTIDLVENGQPSRRVVTVEGSRPGLFGERIPPIRSMGFLEGCRYVVFTYLFDRYLLELATGAIGRLPGTPLRSLRNHPPAFATNAGATSSMPPD